MVLKSALSVCAAALALPAIAEQTLPDGRDLYLRYCSSCHANDARGGAGDTATPAPDLTKIAERRNAVWPMLEIMSIIDGYTKTTEPRPGMPVISELLEGAQVEFDPGNGMTFPVPANLVAVVQYLESVQSPKPESYVP